MVQELMTNSDMYDSDVDDIFDDVVWILWRSWALLQLLYLNYLLTNFTLASLIVGGLIIEFSIFPLTWIYQHPINLLKFWKFVKPFNDFQPQFN